MTKFANFSGVGSNVRPPAQYLGEALKQFQGTVTGIQDRAQQQANKEIEQQRLADALALQQQEAKNLAAYREGQLGLQRESNELAFDKQLETEAQALRNNVTNKYMSDILASKDKAEAQAKLAKYRNDAIFSPDANALKLLSSYLNPTTNPVKGTTYYNKAGEALQVPDGGEVPKGYVSSAMWKNLYGDSSSGTSGSKAEKQASSYTKLKTKVAEFGKMDAPEAIANIEKLQAMKVPPSLVEDALIKASADTIFDNTFTYADMDKYLPEFTTSAGNTVKLGTYLQEAEKLGATVTYDEKTKTLNMTKPKMPKSTSNSLNMTKPKSTSNSLLEQTERLRSL